ncbi:MAG: VPGUxxT family thioredoxin-like (seleno)protein, type 2 [Luteolibacter sp.]
MKKILLLSLAILTSCSADPTKNENPVEVGTVTWLRDLPTALEKSKSTGKPVFLLFQEVPGCAGCKQFGQDVLSDPSVVKSAEQDFIPLLIHNNSGGKDAEVLKKYNEPAWNYQVVRFLDSSGKDLIPRKDRVWTKEQLQPRMKSALEKAGKPQASTSPATKKLALCQHCFWTGEMKIGAIEGVTTTEAGFISGREVTLVEYDPAKTSLQKIISKAKAENVATAIYLENPAELPGSQKLTNYRPAPASDQKKQIQGTAFAKLTLTPQQATKVNAHARSNPNKALQYLTPTQKARITN